ncbi:hypothetical protein ACP4OV_019573 [Aristida adscensionis]
MAKPPPPPCVAAPLSPSSRASSLFSSVSSSSASSSGSCYVPPRSPSPEPKKKKRSKRKCNGRAGAAMVVPRSGSSIYKGVTRGTRVQESMRRTFGTDAPRVQPRTGWADKEFLDLESEHGAYDTEEKAAHAYDLAALKYWGLECAGILNFPLESYKQEREKMQRMSREAYLATLRRRSSGFSRGHSVYRGVARHHQNGRWEARIGHASRRKYLYLGTFETQEAAAQAYDLAALELRGHSAITNFDISRYSDHLHPRVPRAQRTPPLVKPKAEPVDEPPLSTARQTPPLLEPKPEPWDDDEELPPPPPPPPPVLRDADDAEHAIAEILPALGMDPADFEARYPPRRARARALAGCCGGGGSPADDLPLPDHGAGFVDDIEAWFDEPGPAAAAASADAVSFAAAAAATISSLAAGRWW